MSNLLIKAGMVLALSSLALSSAMAGEWEVWTEKQGADRLTIVASFSGDGLIEEAQLDLKLNGQFEVLNTQTLQKGSVCVASAEKNIIRAVPPSGAGTALKSKTTDACMFTLRVAAKKGWSVADTVSVVLNECASSVDGIVPCGVSVKSVK